MLSFAPASVQISACPARHFARSVAQRFRVKHCGAVFPGPAFAGHKRQGYSGERSEADPSQPLQMGKVHSVSEKD